MDLPANKRKGALSALFFASNQPLSMKQIISCLDPDKTLPQEIWLHLLEEIKEDIKKTNWGIELRQHAGGYQFVTQSSYLPWLKALSNSTKTEKLSVAACEILALLAMQNAMTRSQIEQARGVDSGAVIQSLLEKSMIESKGRSSGPTSSVLFGLSEGFYQHFNIKDREHLKKLYESSFEAKS
jgi:segregation and condensation protein B